MESGGRGAVGGQWKGGEKGVVEGQWEGSGRVVKRGRWKGSGRAVGGAAEGAVTYMRSETIRSCAWVVSWSFGRLRSQRPLRKKTRSRL